jgi:hypothetical protein
MGGENAGATKEIDAKFAHLYGLNTLSCSGATAASPAQDRIARFVVSHPFDKMKPKGWGTGGL